MRKATPWELLYEFTFGNKLATCDEVQLECKPIQQVDQCLVSCHVVAMSVVTCRRDDFDIVTKICLRISQFMTIMTVVFLVLNKNSSRSPHRNLLAFTPKKKKRIKPTKTHLHVSVLQIERREEPRVIHKPTT